LACVQGLGILAFRYRYRVIGTLARLNSSIPSADGRRHRPVWSVQQLREVLPCDVRVIGETHPLFGRLLAARSFKRWNGTLMLVVDLPDGSPGTIRADATDVFGSDGAQGVVSVLDAAGLRELYSLVQRLCASRVAGIADKAQVGSPRP
jgi:hypothetical protein